MACQECLKVLYLRTATSVIAPALTLLVTFCPATGVPLLIGGALHAWGWASSAITFIKAAMNGLDSYRHGESLTSRRAFDTIWTPCIIQLASKRESLVIL